MTRVRRRHSTAVAAPPPPQGLEWVLHMYSSGAVRDYRFAYDFMAPSLPELLRTLGSMQEEQEAQRAQRAAARRAGGSAAAPQASVSADEQQALGTEGAASGEGAQQAAVPRQRRSLQPLLPAACAMALLPRGGRMHAGGGA